MSTPSLNLSALKLAEDLPVLLKAGKAALIAINVINVLQPRIDEVAKLTAVGGKLLNGDLHNLTSAILLGDRIDYRLGGGHSEHQQVNSLFILLQKHFKSTEPVWNYVTVPDGEKPNEDAEPSLPTNPHHAAFLTAGGAQCPHCGSDAPFGPGVHTITTDQVEASFSCECGARWNNFYKLTSFTDLEPEPA